MSEPTTGGQRCENCGVTVPPLYSHRCNRTTTEVGAPLRCPCCDGWGARDVWQPAQSTSAPDRVACPACGGTGVLWK